MVENERENLIADKSFEFALRVVELYTELISKQKYVISKQVLKSGTSIGANVQEAQTAQSSKDFISKMAIASKEARGTGYWVLLLSKSQFILNLIGTITPLLHEIDDIINILTKIVKT